MIKIISLPLIFTLLFFVILKTINSLPTTALRPFSQNSIYAPVDAVSFLKNNPIASNKKLLNSYGWGGYLLWIWPEKNIFIDGKMPQRLLHNDITFLEEYDSFFKQDSFSKKLDQHAIQVVMLPIQKNFSFNSVKEKRLYKLIFSLEENDFQKEPYLLNYLDQHWIKLFEDEIAVIYLRPVNN